MEYMLQLSQQDVLLIFQALGELPLKVTLNTFGKVQQQVSKQDADNAVELSQPADKAA